MESFGAPQGIDRWRVSSRRRALVVLAVIVPVILACTSVTKLSTAPASSVKMLVFFSGALIPGATATVSVVVYDAHNNPVAFTGGQSLTVDGITIPEKDDGSNTIPKRIVTIARIAAGTSAYTFTYDDGQGHQTTVSITAPRADFALLQPTPGSQIPLPKPVGAGGQSVVTPLPYQPVETPLPYQPRPPELADTPLALRYGLPYLPAALPSATSVDAGQILNQNRYTLTFDLNGPCASQWPQCSGIYSSVGDPSTTNAGAALTGAWSVDDSTHIWGAGFETLSPGPGSITARMDVGWNMPGTEFGNFYVEFHDSVSAPITWVVG